MVILVILVILVIRALYHPCPPTGCSGTSLAFVRCRPQVFGHTAKVIMPAYNGCNGGATRQRRKTRQVTRRVAQDASLVTAEQAKILFANKAC